MSKLNVTEGEWYYILDNYLGFYVSSDDGSLLASEVYNEEDAILMSKSKKLYEQLETTNKELAFVINAYNKLVKDPCDFFDAETCHLNQILLAQCRGESLTCKN